MTRESLLAAMQRRLWRLVTAPEGVRAGLAAEREAAPLASLVTSDALLSAEERLDVYANAYFYRILEVLCDDYPTLAGALGETEFHDLATSYLAVHPSEHPSLRFIGARLEAFLRASEAAAGVRTRAPWAADLCAFEWAKGEVFDATDATPAVRGDLAEVPPDRFDAIGLSLVPAVLTLALAWPVDELTSNSETLADEATQLTLQPTTLCVWRQHERSAFRRVDALEATALTRLREGRDGGEGRSGLRFGALCAFCAESLGDDEAPALAAAWLARWLDDGLLLVSSDGLR